MRAVDTNVLVRLIARDDPRGGAGDRKRESEERVHLGCDTCEMRDGRPRQHRDDHAIAASVALPGIELVAGGACARGSDRTGNGL